jgi:hypothetical protein
MTELKPRPLWDAALFVKIRATLFNHLRKSKGGVPAASLQN